MNTTTRVWTEGLIFLFVALPRIEPVLGLASPSHYFSITRYTSAPRGPTCPPHGLPLGKNFLKPCSTVVESRLIPVQDRTTSSWLDLGVGLSDMQSVSPVIQVKRPCSNLS